MTQTENQCRVLIYSHDSFGLGHLRRCRAIAHALVEHHPGMSVLILSGSPIIGNFDFRSRVDFVRIPGVIKLRNGEYTSLSLSLKLDIEHTLAMRASIIQHTADVFDPDIFLVDKEPLGLRGEVGDTLEMLKARGTPLVLGLRDVMDEPALLGPEWERKNVLPALRDLYDEIWIYGLPQICNPLEDISLPASVLRKTVYTGYLQRTNGDDTSAIRTEIPFDEPYLLLTPGGGGDGEALVDWVLSAYEYDSAIPVPALVVFGPFMPPEIQAEFARRAAKLGRIQTMTFDAKIEPLIKRAAGLVRWAVTTHFARSCHSTSRPSSCRVPNRAWSNTFAHTGPISLAWSRCWSTTAVARPSPWRPRCAICCSRASRRVSSSPACSTACRTSIGSLRDGSDSVADRR